MRHVFSLMTELTYSERRVATLAACGHSNRTIALRLHITVSTVEQHLTRVYRKLAVAGRAELEGHEALV
ncbi:helix-turn-helix transcriptional regulator [Saccharothrix sp. HUAS TT1]|uniref:helix-turn-helix domain-containing protein n=1 Tax=unclassified Saccharothrix TaxID=2593673 RepID=UPI00345C10AE